MSLYTQLLILEILTYSHIFHFRRNNTLPGIVHLCYLFAGLSPVRWFHMLKTQRIKRVVGKSHTSVLGSNLWQLLHIPPSRNPLFAQARKTLFKINLDIRVCIRAARIIYIHIIIMRNHAFTVYNFDSIRQLYLAHAHFYIMQLAIDIDFFRCGIRITYCFFCFHIVLFIGGNQSRNEVSGLLAAACRACAPRPAR
ncbi:uncharacterized protein BN472_02591 [Tannerella sp. CAG:118]|nr:uncharacterized protein BN472_02591 [Tannerella sp. CAG:118]